MADPMRSLIAVLGATVLVGFIDEVLAQTLVRAGADTPLDLASYLAARNQPLVLGGTIAAHVPVAVMAGYVAAKTARVKELRHAGAAAAQQTAAYAWVFTTGESGALVRARAQAIRSEGPVRLEERM